MKDITDGLSLMPKARQWLWFVGLWAGGVGDVIARRGDWLRNSADRLVAAL